MPSSHSLSRRPFLGSLGTVAAAALLRPAATFGEGRPVLTRAIPSSGEALPIVGLGTWITFNVGEDAAARDARAEVLGAFIAAGGALVDSSPMYGSSEAVVGHGLARLGRPEGLFAATKVWISAARSGPGQIEESRGLWGVDRFDLLQVHNLLSWEAHLETLFAMKAEGRVRHVGVTTSHGRRHDELEAIMTTQPIDFVQLTYNIADREAEERLLPLAAERGIGVIVNRPFQQGALVDDLAGEPLPGWAAEVGCQSWAQILLKFAISHPAVTCAIPATSRLDHLRENMAAARGPLPDAALRARMAADHAEL